jgi:hypothetical protein
MKDIPQHRSIDCLGLFVAALLIRATLIGLAPYADEGHYAASSYFHYLGYTKGLFSDGAIIPAFGGLELYSLLLSWIYFIPVEPYFLFRLADAAFAASAGVMLYKYLYLATNWRLPAWLAALLFILASNHTVFIEAGARNPIPAATFFLFCTLYLLQREQAKKWLFSSICLAASILLREQFLMFAGIVFMYVWHGHGLRIAARLCAFTAMLVALAILFVAELRGGMGNVATMIDTYATHTNPEFHLSLEQRAARGIRFGISNLVLLAFCLPSVLLGLCTPLIDPALRTRQHISIYFLGAGLMLAPLAEVLAKAPYPYHLAQALTGAAIFSCHGWYICVAMIRKVALSRAAMASMLTGSVLLAHGALLQDYLQTLRWCAQWSLHYAPVMVFGDWSSPAVHDAYYLQEAAIIRKHTRFGDKILSTSYNIYPLTGTIPLSRKTASLSTYRFTSNGINRDQEIADLIRESRPIVYLEEGAMSQSNGQRVDVIGRELAGIYPLSHDVGPRLQPYRGFFARIHVLVEHSDNRDQTGQ